MSQPSEPSRDSECQICGASPAAHLAAEVHHIFSPDGQLHPKPGKKVPTNRAAQPGVGDTVLRLITVLRAKGLLTDVELGAIFAGGAAHDTHSAKPPGDPTDHQPGPGSMPG